MNVNMVFFDYKAYGRDMTINETGQLTDYGYVRDTLSLIHI